MPMNHRPTAAYFNTVTEQVTSTRKVEDTNSTQNRKNCSRIGGNK